MADIPVPDAREGRGLVPILKTSSAEDRRVFMYEYFGDFPYRVPPVRAVRTGRYAYIE